MLALPKLYDNILTARLQKWYTPDIEQAGAQRGRNCEEQILALRLLIDIATKERRKLYILFVDFEKAYDRVNRGTLITLLKNMGCGSAMLQALKNSIKKTTSLLGDSEIQAKTGVRQGSPSSCFLFTAYVNPLIRMIKEYGEDGWLGVLHLLLFMDDTVIFSSTRKGIEWKLKRLMDYCSQYDMKVNAKKTKLIVINSEDREPLIYNELKIELCEKYVYLGNTIIASSLQKQIDSHLKENMKHVYKFRAFLSKNSEAPLYVKMKVWSCLLLSSLFYGAETWWTSNMHKMNNIYLATLRDCLGVRTTTCSDVIYAEVGKSSSSAYVKDKQLKFLAKVRSRSNYEGSYLQQLISKACQSQSPMGKYCQALERETRDPIKAEIENIKQKILDDQNSTRRMTYRQLNNNLESPAVYHRQIFIPEHHRIAFTRFRVGSHRFRIETGRWSRTPREGRLCPCGEVQDEIRHKELCIIKRYT